LGQVIKRAAPNDEQRELKGSPSGGSAPRTPGVYRLKRNQEGQGKDSNTGKGPAPPPSARLHD